MSFVGIIGQERVGRILKRIIASERYSSLIFAGQSGVGKRTIAIKFAQETNCEMSPGAACGKCHTCSTISRLAHPDIRIILPIRKPKDATPEGVAEAMAKLSESYAIDKTQPSTPPSYQISIEAIRWIRKEMAKPPYRAKLRIFIVLNAHQMTSEAQNALLKMLEEPQPNTIFILTTDGPEALLATIRSRCQVIRFANIPEREIKHWLETRFSQSTFPLDLIAALAQGSLGKAHMIAQNPNSYFSTAIIEFFKDLIIKTKQVAPESLIIDTIDDLVHEKTSLSTAINTAIFLTYNSLRAQLGCSHLNLPILQNLTKLPPRETFKKLQFLYSRLRDLNLNTNLTFTFFSLLYNLKKNKQAA
ncbi:MAG: DNA polymerase III subunit [bacterium]